MRLRMARLMVCALTAWAVSALPSTAQVSTGRIDATVVDSTGAVLPGVTVDISGPQNQSAVTDTQGEAHFLNLAPGTYTVAAKLAGFSDYLNKSVVVGTGAGVPLRVSMGVAGVNTQVTVTGESPLLDTTKTTTTTHVDVAQLQNIPSSRDPWVVLQTVPGVMVDRVNVGGAESGQQSAYSAKGASGGDNTWNLDGVAITDMAATGSTPTYYDFDMFQEMQVTTGGADVQSATPGVQLNMVLKSGTNTPHGSSRYYFENESLQSNNMPADLAATIGGATGKGNRMHKYTDYGFELGGPIVKNRAWAWGAWGKTQPDLITLTGSHDRTVLEDTSFKATAQVTNAIRANYTFFRGNKQKFGRGAGPLRPDETTYNQTGPTDLNKGEVNFVLGNNFFLAAKVGHVHGGFELAARGGPNVQMYIDDAGVQHGSADTYITNRPQNTFAADGNTFHGHHELKFGFGWRKASVQSSDVYPGNGLITYFNGYPDLLAKITRPNQLATNTKYSNAYLSDTFTHDRFTLNLGARWDRQASSLEAASVPASPVLPTLLPAISATPVNNAVVWNSLTPRVGLTYALDQDRKTLLRASYSMFASQLGATAAGAISTVQYSAIYYYATDLNGNKIADPNEIQYGLGNIGYYGFDPSNPSKLTTNNQIGKYKTPMTQEVMAGVDRELVNNFAVTGTFTYRYYNHFVWSPLIGVTAADYHQAGTFTGSIDPVGQFSVPFYAINPGAVPPGGGTSYEEHTGYHQRYIGFEASAVKRMSNHWMARFGFSTNKATEYGGSNNSVDPTSTPTNPNINGGDVVNRTGGSGKSNIYLVQPRYQLIANGMYQAKWGINFGANWLYRQGYAVPYFHSRVATGDVLSNFKTLLVAPNVDTFRLAGVSSLDGRVEKAFKFIRAQFALDLDIFNITNNATVLGRQYDTRVSTFNTVQEIMNPRILRLGARINF